MDATATAIVEGGLLTVLETARFLGVGRSTVYDLLSSGAIPHVKIGRSTRVPRAAVIVYAARNLRGVTCTPWAETK